MSEPITTGEAAPDQWHPLSTHERRVLGVLAEKQKTTPDTYPLSLNALQTGCNQKSNREPVLDLSDVDVEDALLSLKEKGLVFRITGGRVERWRHGLYEAWRVDKAEMAILAELLLRDPQTEGELRGRANRMEPFPDLDALRAALRKLTERGLVVYLSPEGRRGAALTHGFHTPEELSQLKAGVPAAPASPAAEPRASRASVDHSGIQAEVNDLRNIVTELQAAVAELQEQVRVLRGGGELAQ